MGEAFRAIDFVEKARQCLPLAQHTVELRVRPTASALLARHAPVVLGKTPDVNELVIEVMGLQASEDALFPLVVTWEILVGGEKILDLAPVLRRKTFLPDSGVQRTGRLFTYTGPAFRQFSLVGRLAPSVGGVKQPGEIKGFADIAVSFRHGVTSESVTIGSAIG